MNFLQLVNRLRLESGASNAELSTVSGVSDEAKRLANWINQAWTEIQTAEVDWHWMRDTFSFQTINQKPTYTPAEAGITSFASWKIDSIRCWVTASGYGSEQYLQPMEYGLYRDRYQYGAYRLTYTRPLECAVTPDKQLALGPTPTAGYTINGEYFKAPTVLDQDGDTPEMPERFHMVIVYLAMRFYGLYEAAPEVLTRANDGFVREMARLRLDQRMGIEQTGALA